MPYDYLVLLILFLLIITCVISYNIYLNRSYNENLKFMAESAWENQIERKYNSQNIKFLLDGKEKVDSLTWNDLEMDQIFSYFDRSFSIAGSQALYKKLHSLNYSIKDKKIIDEILENKDAANKLGKNFLKYINFKDDDFFELLKTSSPDEKIKAMKPLIYACFFLNLFSLALFFVNMLLALLLFLILRIVSGVINHKVSKLSSAKYKSFLSIRNLQSLCLELQKSDLKLEGLIEDLDKHENLIKLIRKNLGSIYTKTGSDIDFIFTSFDNLFLHQARTICKSTDFVNENLESINNLYKGLADIDMYLGLAISYESIEDKCMVDFNEDNLLSAKNLHNPILYYKGSSVPNTFEFNKSVLLTGSNASGKSTFLRSLGSNIIFAESLGFAFADYFSLPRKNLYSAIDIRDSIDKNVSYFMAETLAIKRMIENKNSIYILDEIFKGTNTIDRISAALFTLKYLSKQGLVIAASHDIELTKLLDNFDNYHFEEIIENKDIVFDYKLKEGPSKTRNAIEILKIENYPDEIVEKAKEFSKILEDKKIEI